MAHLKEATAQEVVFWNDTQHHWNISFWRNSNDWEEEEGVLSCLALLVNTKVAFVGDNEILCPHDSSGRFTMKSYGIEMYKGSVNFIFQPRQCGSLALPPKLTF